MKHPHSLRGALLLAAAPLLISLSACGTDPVAASPESATMSNASPLPDSSVYRVSAKTLAGEDLDLSAYQGKVTMFVNVASKCGYTPQYKDLQELHEELGGEGFAIVGVPSNDFGGQEPGTPQEITAFCQENYGVTFQMLEKQGTKEGASPLFDRLAALTEGKRPGWNFCKYVVSKDGATAQFFESAAKPGGQEIRSAIESL
jgi:glutathione peroxidase